MVSHVILFIGTLPEKRAHHPVDASQSLKVVLGKVAKTDGLEEILLPALHAAIDTDRDKTLFANRAAVTSGLVSGRHMRKCVRKIVKLAPIEQLRGHVVLQPKHLGDFHLDAHLATNVSKQVVLGVIDLLGLCKGSMVKPQHDVPIVSIIGEIRAGHWDRLIGVVGEDGKRACRIETNTLDAVGVNLGLCDHLLDANADGVPDVSGRLLLWGKY